MHLLRPTLNAEEVYVKWENIGFLGGLTPNQGRMMSLIFEKSSNYLVENDSALNEEIHVAVFPIIRRIYVTLDADGLAILFNCETVIEEVNRLWEPTSEYFNQYLGDNSRDIEADMAEFLADMVKGALIKSSSI